MTDNDKLIHQIPLPNDDVVTPEEEENNQANRLAVGFAMFMPLGIVVGLLVLDNIGLGVALGLAAGVVYSLVVPKLWDNVASD